MTNGETSKVPEELAPGKSLVRVTVSHNAEITEVAVPETMDPAKVESVGRKKVLFI